MRQTAFVLCLALVACVSGERLYGRTLAAAEGTPVDAFCTSPPVGPPGTNAAFNQLCTSGVSGRTVYVAGQRGRTCTDNSNATTCSLVPIGADLGKDRIRAAYRNMKIFAESQGASINDCLRIVCYVSNNGVYNATRFGELRLFANQVQGEAEFWGTQQPKCARTIVGVDWLNENDIFEVEGTFWARK